MKSKKIINIIYILILPLIMASYLNKFNLIDLCKYFTLKDNLIIDLYHVCVVIIITVLFLIIKKEKISNWKFYLFVPLVFFLVANVFPEKSMRKELSKKNAIIQKAYITKINKSNQTSFIHLKYNNTRFGLRAYNFQDSKLSVGDSLYIIYAIDCKSLIDFYEPFPTKEQFLQWKDKSYLINGKIYSEKEYEEIKNN